MGFTTSCFIRKNTSELRKKLEELGHTICKCCEFDGADWLHIITHKYAYYTVHGIGYDGEYDEIYGTLTQEERFIEFLKTTQSIDCGENEELFLALAALRDDTPINSYYWFNNKLVMCYSVFDLNVNQGVTYRFMDMGNPKICFPSNIDCMRKATVEEIIEHFK